MYLLTISKFLFVLRLHFEDSSIDFNCIFCMLFGRQISALVTFHNSLQSQCKIILILESFLDLNLEVYLTYLLSQLSQLRLCECRWRGTTHLQLSQPFFVLILVRIVCERAESRNNFERILVWDRQKGLPIHIRRLSWKLARRLLRVASESR